MSFKEEEHIISFILGTLKASWGTKKKVHLIFYEVFLLIPQKKSFLSFPTPTINSSSGLMGKRGTCSYAFRTVINTHVNYKKIARVRVQNPNLALRTSFYFFLPEIGSSFQTLNFLKNRLQPDPKD